MPATTIIPDLKSSYRYVFFLFLAFSVGPTNNFYSQTIGNNFRIPAEFETHQAVWLSWEDEDTSVQETVINIIKGLAGKVPIKIAAPTSDIQKSAKKTLLAKGIDISRIQFHILPGGRLWIRDNGATFLINNEKDLASIDFEWSSYGIYDWLFSIRPEFSTLFEALKTKSLNDQYSKADKEMSKINKARVIKSNLVMEGGSLETNGKGVLIQCEQVTLQRNPDWTKEEIEEEYRRIMNITKVIWLKKGTADDSRPFIPNSGYISLGTGGHTDEFVRFADANTILLAWIDEDEIGKHPLNDITHERMQENYEILKNSANQDGKPFKIIKIPVPSVIEWTAEVTDKEENMDYTKLNINRLATQEPLIGKKITRVASVSYLNFFMSNGVLINASYTNHGTPTKREDKVKAIFKEAFPNLEQVWIDTLPLNRMGGGIHCITLQEPLHKLPEKFIFP